MLRTNRKTDGVFCKYHYKGKLCCIVSIYASCVIIQYIQGSSRGTVVRTGLQINRSSYRSCTWGMFHKNISWVQVVPRPSIAWVQNRGLKQHSFVHKSPSSTLSTCKYYFSHLKAESYICVEHVAGWLRHWTRRLGACSSIPVTCKSLGQALHQHLLCPPNSSGYQVEW